MSRRIDVELTSDRGDGSWTWRAAGAKQPKGVLAASLLYDGASVGDVVRAEADFLLDGIEIVAVMAPKQKKAPKVETLELLGSGRDEQLVTTTLAPKRGKGDRGDRGDRPRRDGDKRRGPRRDGGERNSRGRGRDDNRGPRNDGERKGGGNRHDRPRRDDRPARPKVPRLKPAREHRRAAVAALEAEQRPLAEELLRNGIAGVRTIIERQNAAAEADNSPRIRSERLLPHAEMLLKDLRAAEWHDRAIAAVAGVDEVDLRDLRSVVVAAEQSARTDETRELADQLRDGLARRVESEHQQWLAEIAETLADGRTVRALRLSSRPPKAGAPLPSDMAERLAAAASEGLTSDITQDRFATVLDAVAFSPVRLQVNPISVPAEPAKELTTALTRLADRIPHIAALFGVTPAPPKRRGRGRGGSGRSGAKPAKTADSASAPPVPPPPPVPDTTSVEATPAPKESAPATEPMAETVTETQAAAEASTAEVAAPAEAAHTSAVDSTTPDDDGQAG